MVFTELLKQTLQEMVWNTVHVLLSSFVYTNVSEGTYPIYFKKKNASQFLAHFVEHKNGL